VVAPAASPEPPAANPPLLVVLLGATASGKTALSLALAETFDGEILSCDSVAVYRGMDIGAAKPTPAERARIPHHLLDIASPDQPYSAGDYSRDARQTLAEITERGRLPIVVGGTGLYLRALLFGLFEGPKRSEDLRERLRRSAASRREGYLWRLLHRIDPASAARIHANDTPKLIRAIEVTVAARQPMSAAWQAGREPLRGFRILRIGLDPPREALYARINQRAAAMFTSGLMEETAALLARYGPECAALGALGYRQAAMVQRGEMPLDGAIAATQQGHRNYAKRQMTWFRREPDVVWLRQFGDEPDAIQAARNLVAQPPETTTSQ
jgi:tRNA dimethylallyltransferase